MRIEPYLLFDGNCEEAFTFYQTCLGGTVSAMMRHAGTPAEAHVPPEWHDKILHACLEIRGQRLMASDAPPGRFDRPQGMSVSLYVETPEEAERIFEAFSDGGIVQMPMEETFWAQRFGMVVDRFGTPWMVSGGDLT